MFKFLKEIATIHTGIFAKPSLEGDIVYLQAKHFNSNGNLSKILHNDLKFDYGIQKHLLAPGDVLFAAKGSKNFAAVYENHNPDAVASTSFFVIRLFEKNVLPEYLAWFINHPSSQKLLKGAAKGSSIVSISKSDLEGIRIPIPELDVQKSILKIAQLKSSEKDLQEKIGSLREQIIQQQILNSIK